MFKKIFFHSLSAGILSAIACYLYTRVYLLATEEDFSKVLNTGTLIAFNLAASALAGTGFWVLTTLRKNNGELYFNFTFFILSFISVLIPITIALPNEIKGPDMFPGLAVPMHFFPAMAWFTLRPLFVGESKA